MSNRPLVTILTVSYNSEKTIVKMMDFTRTAKKFARHIKGEIVVEGSTRKKVMNSSVAILLIEIVITRIIT